MLDPSQQNYTGLGDCSCYDDSLGCLATSHCDDTGKGQMVDQGDELTWDHKAGQACIVAL